MTCFNTAAEAQAFVNNQADVPTVECRKRITTNLLFHAYAQKMGSRFTNIYDISYSSGRVMPAIHIHDQPMSAYTFFEQANSSVVTSGGFFFLADVYSCLPRQSALNLAISRGRVCSLPVVDREAAICDGRRLSARFIQARGMLRLNDTHLLSWAGSLTKHKSDVKVFSNGNSVIIHQPHETRGSVRVLDERSRLTPPMPVSNMIDVGFIASKDGIFEARERSLSGGVDIFTHDIVIRGDAKYLSGSLLTLRILTIDSLVIGQVQGAMSVGPMIDTINFDKHPINTDTSLGSRPPFIERPMARMVLYETKAGVMHLRLFDGHPDSDRFPGVTPTQAAEIIHDEEPIKWGCFLDPGKTAKLCMRTGLGGASFGNAHYLTWTTKSGEQYTWAPMTGRPTASMITLS